ncbi:hypothetical protein TNCV_650441 [Trichonephila clavipes]|nr:hypothetical protein TNCV_650441 [Trichonephila clavipes]
MSPPVSSCPLWGSRRRAVAEFRQAARHDYLRNHLYTLKVVHFPICTQRNSRDVMDSSHLLHSPVLRKAFLVECYSEARDMLD